MPNSSPLIKSFVCSFLLLGAFIIPLTSRAQSPQGTLPSNTQGSSSEEGVGTAPMKTLVNNVYFMPYLTGSANFHSGTVFPKSATGIGYGFGFAFDLADSGQKLGAYFDLAYQDMRAAADDGTFQALHPSDSTLSLVRAQHYFQYLELEGFLKVQGAKDNGYLLIGASLGYAVAGETFQVGPYRTTLIDWSGTDNFHPIRLDLRLGLGITLAKFGTHKLILEARAGYPITTAVFNYLPIGSSSTTPGDWRIITIQANLGYRF